ncbi:MAG: pyrroline-5-carboxylate reductase [Terrimicrobiaceae bacterium]|nr:pyrroline-5-carboxylate reductase [Terrimicrobiaceae bacterium]
MKIATIGAGRMAGALVRGLVHAGVCTPADIAVADAIPTARERLAADLGARAVATNADAVADADVVLLCVKPADVSAALGACADALSGRLLISIAAGWSIDSLGKHAGAARIVRAMPNTPAQIGAGATAYAGGPTATADDLALAGRILGAVGLAVAVPERMLDAVTGLSGSGPAYVFLVMEALSDAGVAAGLPRPLATQLAVQTVLGAARLAAETNEPPAQLREAVTSPGGTTAAALRVLDAANVRSAFGDAVRAATDRSRELGQ